MYKVTSGSDVLFVLSSSEVSSLLPVFRGVGGSLHPFDDRPGVYFVADGRRYELTQEQYGVLCDFTRMTASC